MLSEGSFPLMETDEMNFQILQNATKALKAERKFIFTTLNRLFTLFHSVKDFLADHDEENKVKYENNTFDLMSFRNYITLTIEDNCDKEKILECNESYYVLSEIMWLLKSLNYKNIDIYGAKLGAFSRSDKLTTQDFEMLVIANKK